MKNRLFSAFLLGATILAGPVACTEASDNGAALVQAGTEVGINIAALDTSIKPGDDFYGYANGSWMKNTEIPADRSSAGSFLVSVEQTEKYNKELIANILSSNPKEGSNEAHIANFYKAFDDTKAIEAAGMKPIQADLDRIAALADKDALATELGSSTRADVDPLNATDYTTENLFGVFVTQGLATPGEVLPYLLQGGLGLPERDYYFSTEAKTAAIRKTYRAYIAKLLTAAGVEDADAKAERIFALETKIAKAHVPRAQSENFAASADVWTRADFDSKAPGLNWQNYFEAAQLAGQEKFSAYHSNAYAGLSALVASEPLEAWKDWLAFHQINTHAAVLPAAIDDAHFEFYGTTLRGTPQQRSREKRSLAAVNNYLGDAVGQIYVAKYFPPSSKAAVSSLVDNIVAAFGKRVEAIDWMDPKTKKEALAKVNSIVVGVGYPETWRDYSKVTMVADNAYANMVAAEKAEYAHQIAKIGKPMDRAEWWMTPQIVNAVNIPVQNALNFPAGILQPPFFEAKADPAFNYAAIGAVIGHEIVHSFDNNGADFDSTGALRNWWTKEDLAEFDKQGKALAKQYDEYEPFPGLHVNGTLTLGENIADVAGLEASYAAYRASLGGKEAPVIDGFTGDQRFFIAFAQTWATKMREAALRGRIATGSHAPGQYRALTVRNLDAWYKAFDVKPGDKQYLAPEKRVKIW